MRQSISYRCRVYYSPCLLLRPRRCPRRKVSPRILLRSLVCNLSFKQVLGNETLRVGQARHRQTVSFQLMRVYRYAISLLLCRMDPHEFLSCEVGCFQTLQQPRPQEPQLAVLAASHALTADCRLAESRDVHSQDLKLGSLDVRRVSRVQVYS